MALSRVMFLKNTKKQIETLLEQILGHFDSYKQHFSQAVNHEIQEIISQSQEAIQKLDERLTDQDQKQKQDQSRTDQNPSSFDINNILINVTSVMASAVVSVKNNFEISDEEYQSCIKRLKSIQSILVVLKQVDDFIAQNAILQLKSDLQLLLPALQQALIMIREGRVNTDDNINVESSIKKVKEFLLAVKSIFNACKGLSSSQDLISLQKHCSALSKNIQLNISHQTFAQIQSFIKEQKQQLSSIFSKEKFVEDYGRVQAQFEEFIQSSLFIENKIQSDGQWVEQCRSELSNLWDEYQLDQHEDADKSILNLYKHASSLCSIESKIVNGKIPEMGARLAQKEQIKKEQEKKRIERESWLQQKQALSELFKNLVGHLMKSKKELTDFFGKLPSRFYDLENGELTSLYFTTFSSGRRLADLYRDLFFSQAKHSISSQQKELKAKFDATENGSDLSEFVEKIAHFKVRLVEETDAISQCEKSIMEELAIYNAVCELEVGRKKLLQQIDEFLLTLPKSFYDYASQRPTDLFKGLDNSCHLILVKTGLEEMQSKLYIKSPNDLAGLRLSVTDFSLQLNQKKKLLADYQSSIQSQVSSYLQRQQAEKEEKEKAQRETRRLELLKQEEEKNQAIALTEKKERLIIEEALLKQEITDLIRELSENKKHFLSFIDQAEKKLLNSALERKSEKLEGLVTQFNLNKANIKAIRKDKIRTSQLHQAQSIASALKSANRASCPSVEESVEQLTHFISQIAMCDDLRKKVEPFFKIGDFNKKELAEKVVSLKRVKQDLNELSHQINALIASKSHHISSEIEKTRASIQEKIAKQEKSINAVIQELDKSVLGLENKKKELLQKKDAIVSRPSSEKLREATGECNSIKAKNVALNADLLGFNTRKISHIGASLTRYNYHQFALNAVERRFRASRDEQQKTYKDSVSGWKNIWKRHLDWRAKHWSFSWPKSFTKPSAAKRRFLQRQQVLDDIHGRCVSFFKDFQQIIDDKNTPQHKLIQLRQLWVIYQQLLSDMRVNTDCNILLTVFNSQFDMNFTNLQGASVTIMLHNVFDCFRTIQNNDAEISRLEGEIETEKGRIFAEANARYGGSIDNYQRKIDQLNQLKKDVEAGFNPRALARDDASSSYADCKADSSNMVTHAVDAFFNVAGRMAEVATHAATAVVKVLSPSKS